MEKLKNDLGKTVGIRVESASEFNEALSTARRLFSSIEQREDLLISEKAWPHYSPQQPNEPMSQSPYKSLAEALLEADDQGLIRLQEANLPMPEEVVEAVGGNLPGEEDYRAYQNRKTGEALEEILEDRFSEETARLLEGIVTADEAPLFELLEAAMDAYVEGSAQAQEAFEAALREEGLELRGHIL